MTIETVSVTIDGVVVQVPKGTAIIEAAKQAGVLVPHYCYHPGLSSPAMCRLCLVEIKGAPKLVPSCVTASIRRGETAIRRALAIRSRTRQPLV